jgi:hypothetical protein
VRIELTAYALPIRHVDAGNCPSRPVPVSYSGNRPRHWNSTVFDILMQHLGRCGYERPGNGQPEEKNRHCHWQLRALVQ